MNKKVIVIIIVVTILLLGGLGAFFGIRYINNKPFKLEQKYYENMSIVDIDAKRFGELVDKKENFILYMYLDGCTTCAAFKPIATEFVIRNKITVYRIEYKEFAKTSISDKIEYAPSMIIMKKGKLKAFLKADSNDDLKYYRDVDELQKWFTKYIEL